MNPPIINSLKPLPLIAKITKLKKILSFSSIKQPLHPGPSFKIFNLKNNIQQSYLFNTTDLFNRAIALISKFCECIAQKLFRQNIISNYG